ncbi:MAG: HEPN domain-containing protein [Caldilineaceae bacterium SB0675_bin_29]|uniref:HEPN domain-containing protein n=1 Tax=Caldilineaceae bacterium SB0675_bin_29 TaxID=2605266 RepID=A0A6B1FT24_9CHLR|nr:HEPN domain-containing protein [Caldilineaceae bacterium SB0675_bin_29]
MKTPERFPPDDPREWLNRARSNLALAKNRIPGAYLEDLCFEAQQAAEKSLKAVMVLRSIQFPFVHDLSRLVSMIEKEGVEVPEVLLRAEKLTIYAVITRYPGVVRPVTEQEYLEAVEIADSVVLWAEKTILAC